MLVWEEWKRLEDRIRWILTRLVPDYDDLDDVTQLCLIKVWQKGDSFEGSSAFSSWLYRVVRNEHVSWTRRETAVRRAEARACSARLTRAYQTSAERPVLARVSADRHLARLDPETRHMLELIGLLDMTAGEVGRELGLAPSSVRCRLHRARAVLDPPTTG